MYLINNQIWFTENLMLVDKLKEANNYISKQNEERVYRSKKFNKLASAYFSLEDEVGALKNIVETGKNYISELEKELNKLSSEHFDLQGKYNNLNYKCEELGQDKNKLRDQLECLEDKYKLVNYRCEELAETNTKLEDQESINASLKVAMAHSIIAFREDNNKLRADLSQNKSKLTESERKLKVSNKELKVLSEEIWKVNLENTKVRKANREVEQQYAHLHMENSVLKQYNKQ